VTDTQHTTVKPRPLPKKDGEKWYCVLISRETVGHIYVAATSEDDAVARVMGETEEEAVLYGNWKINGDTVVECEELQEPPCEDWEWTDVCGPGYR
jgi:hypothetical protein